MGSFATENELPTAPEAPAAYTLNDAGRAAQFVDNHLDEVRYVPAFGRWLLWAGHHWQQDEDGGITRLAVKHSQQLIAAAATIANDAARREAVKEALAMGNAKRIQLTLELAKCDRRVVLSQNDIDSDPFLLGVQNGVVELRTGTFRAGRRDDLITKRAGVSYVPGATCPRWLTFISEVLGDDQALVAYVQKLMGYTLSGDVREHLFPFLYGSGKNGKSVFTETTLKLMGDYGQKAPQSILIASPNGREPTSEVARLHGMRLVVGSETEEGSRLAESRVKDLTGGDTLTGRFLYAEFFDFKPRFKLWMFGNHKPEIRGTDEGIWRRVRLIPFLVHFADHRQDPQLAAKLADELPGILQWAMDGARLWLSDGLKSPPRVNEASAEYREEEDTLADFLGDEVEDAPTGRIESGEMFLYYQAWAARNGIRYPLTLRSLTKQLRERGMRLTRTNGKRRWEGVSLK